MSHGHGNQDEQHSLLLGVSDVELESQIVDDRDTLAYINDSEYRPGDRQSNELHDDSAYASYTSPISHGQEYKPEDESASHGESLSKLCDRESDKPVSWSSLPRKDQLAILTLARLAEPVVQTSLASYMFFMLKSFDESLPDSKISSQAGILAGSFTFAQCLTAVMWGRLADKEWMGRKNVLIIGLIGTFISVLGFGFSKNFLSAMFFRGLGGALNGNVGVMRTMISEIICEKKYQTKAFLIMPVTFNFGVLVGPLLGGWLQDPVHTFPNTFGAGSVFGGKGGVQWMNVFPYALPNMVSAFFLLSSIVLVVLGLEETHVDRRDKSDWGLKISRAIARFCKRLFRCNKSYRYERLETYDESAHELQSTSSRRHHPSDVLPRSRAKLPYRRIFTRNVICTFLVHGLLAAHLGAFHNMYFLFLSTPRYDLSHSSNVDDAPQRLPFHFTGGLGMEPSTIGFALGIIGALGLCMQFGVYTRVTHRLGVMKTYRCSMPLFSVAYCLIPYLVMLPTKHKAPHSADGPAVWIGMSTLLFIVVIGRTFSLPITQILVNNCSPHPSVLSSVHGLGQTVSAGARSLGPVAWSSLYGLGLQKGYVGLGFWTLCLESLLAFAASWLVYEGNGHEIRLPGDP